MLPVAFFVPAAAYLLSKVKTTRPRDPPARRTLLHRCISVMLAYMILIGPFGLRCLADWSVQYSQLTAGDWGQGNRTILHKYDANGSLIEKKTTVTSNEEILETASYQYNLQNRLASVTTSYTEDTNDVNEVTEYTYNDNGIRVKSYYYKTINDGDPEDEQTKIFLIDAHNHTGYPQVLEEWSPSGSHPDITYTIGDDVISQSSSA